MFILLKVLLFFLRPLVWTVILFLIAFFSKNEKRKKRFFQTGFIVLLVFTNPFIIRQLLNWYEVKPIQLPANENYNAAILLGGFVTFDKKDQQSYFTSASDRFIQTALLYKTGRIKKIIVSGGNGYIVKNNFTESGFVKQKFIELGVAANDIYTDTTSRNTLENAVNTKRIIDSLHLQEPFLLISSAMHLPRARLLFEKRGIVVKLYPCDFLAKKDLANNFTEDYILPSAHALVIWDLFIKEIAGIIAYKITGRV